DSSFHRCRLPVKDSIESNPVSLHAALPILRDLGVTCLELMPVHTFPGRFNWGYDSVGLYAPCARYGRPDDLRRLVDQAHRLGLRSEEHTSELQSLAYLVCRLLLEKKKFDHA